VGAEPSSAAICSIDLHCELDAVPVIGRHRASCPPLSKSPHLGLVSRERPWEGCRVTRRGSTIVIVEESAAVQELVEQALRESGDRVLVTQNALEVLDVAGRVRIDLLVIDIDSQQGLVEDVRELQPDLRVLYVSDNTDEQPTKPQLSPLLLTPFSLDELREAIAAGLDRPEPETSVGAETGP
jgi:CheY-like chemotaxis protein